MTTDFLYVESDLGRYNLLRINHAITLHKASDVKANVARELDFFSDGYQKPHSVACHPSIAALNNFKSLLFGSENMVFIPQPGRITADEVSKLCCDRLLSSGHI